MIAKNYRPKYTLWGHGEIRAKVIANKRYCRHAYKRYLKTGNIKDLDRSRRILDRWRWDFD
jgi:hypothetical protein